MRRARLKLKDWPAPEQDAWNRLLVGGGVLRAGGAFASLRPATVNNYEQCYGHWLAFCCGSGVDLSTTTPAERVTAARIDAWTAEMADLKATTRSTRLAGLHRVITALVPGVAHPYLRQHCRHAEWEAKRQVREGKIGRVLPTETLLAGGLAHLDAVTGTTLKDAFAFRDGLMVATLALVPIRISNFRDLEIGRSFLETRSGYSIVLSPNETKTHRPHETELPEVLKEAMDRYITVFRPILVTLAETPHDYLWANDHGRKYSHSNLGPRIKRLTQLMTGTDVNPHLFRDSAATTIARDRPAQSRAIAGVLGHASLKTADRHYNQARCLDASRRFNLHVESLRNATHRARPSKHARRNAS